MCFNFMLPIGNCCTLCLDSCTFRQWITLCILTNIRISIFHIFDMKFFMFFHTINTTFLILISILGSYLDFYSPFSITDNCI